MNHRMHLYLMIGLAVVAVLLFSTGNAGGWVPFVWVGACVLMMFFMMRGMGGMGSGQDIDGMGSKRGTSEDKLARNAGHDRHR